MDPATVAGLVFAGVACACQIMQYLDKCPDKWAKRKDSACAPSAFLKFKAYTAYAMTFKMLYPDVYASYQPSEPKESHTTSAPKDLNEAVKAIENIITRVQPEELVREMQKALRKCQENGFPTSSFLAKLRSKGTNKADMIETVEKIGREPGVDPRYTECLKILLQVDGAVKTLLEADWPGNRAKYSLDVGSKGPEFVLQKLCKDAVKTVKPAHVKLDDAFNLAWPMAWHKALEHDLCEAKAKGKDSTLLVLLAPAQWQGATISTMKDGDLRQIARLWASCHARAAVFHIHLDAQQLELEEHGAYFALLQQCLDGFFNKAHVDNLQPDAALSGHGFWRLRHWHRHWLDTIRGTDQNNFQHNVKPKQLAKWAVGVLTIMRLQLKQVPHTLLLVEGVGAVAKKYPLEVKMLLMQCTAAVNDSGGHVAVILDPHDKWRPDRWHEVDLTAGAPSKSVTTQPSNHHNIVPWACPSSSSSCPNLLQYTVAPSVFVPRPRSALYPSVRY